MMFPQTVFSERLCFPINYRHGVSLLQTKSLPLGCVRGKSQGRIKQLARDH